MAGYGQEKRSWGGRWCSRHRDLMACRALIPGNAEHPAGSDQKEQLRSPRLHLCVNDLEWVAQSFMANIPDKTHKTPWPMSVGNLLTL